MGKITGVLIIVCVIVIATLSKSALGTTNMGLGIFGNILQVVFIGIGWSLFKSSDKASTHDETFGYDFTTKSDTENKSSSKPKAYTNTSNVGRIDGDVSSNDISQLTEIEKIERQYDKGIFTEKEKNDLINKILNEKQNEELEKIKENYNGVLDPYRDKFLEIYSIEYVELEDLRNQGIIDEKTLKSKLKILEMNIAKRIQKEIRFKSIKGFEVYQGLEVKNGNAVGVIVEIINSKEIRAQLNWDNSLTQEWSIVDLTPTGKVNSKIKDWELNENNFLLLNELDYYGLAELKVGDSYKEGEVFFVSNEEVKIVLIFDKSLSAKPMGFEQNTFIQCDYKTLKSKEDNFWKIPDEESVKKCVKYLFNKSKFVPITPELIWTSEMLDNSTTKCVQVVHNDNYNEPSTMMCSNLKHQYGILVQTIKI